MTAVAGAVAVDSDGVTLQGTGTSASKLAIKAVQTDPSLAGAGTVASPLQVNGGGNLLQWTNSLQSIAVGMPIVLDATTGNIDHAPPGGTSTQTDVAAGVLDSPQGRLVSLPRRVGGELYGSFLPGSQENLQRTLAGLLEFLPSRAWFDPTSDGASAHAFDHAQASYRG